MVKRQADEEAKKDESGGGWWGWATGWGSSTAGEEKEGVAAVPMPTGEFEIYSQVTSMFSLD